MIEILASDSRHSIKRDSLTGKLFYRYRVDRGCECCFSLLCEVGEPYKPWFVKRLKALRISPVQVETETDYFDAVPLEA